MSDPRSGVVVSFDTVESVLVGMGRWHEACCVGEAEMCFCITHDGPGRWSVFWMERGNRLDLSEFTDEQAACLEFMCRASNQATVGSWLTELGRPDLIAGVEANHR